MATINIIESDAMEQDNDSGSWLQRRLIVTKIFPIKQLSPPLVIANEHTKIWFLDIIIPQYGTQVINAHSREVMSGLKSLSTIILYIYFQEFSTGLLLQFHIPHKFSHPHFCL